MSAVRDPMMLCPCVRRRRLKLRRVMRVCGIATTTVETIRTPERQARLIARGVSWTKKSKHLPQPPSRLSLAFDEGINAYFQDKLWNPGGVLWDALGAYALEYGLQWGGIWARHPDKPHIYLNRCRCKEDAK